MRRQGEETLGKIIADTIARTEETTAMMRKGMPAQRAVLGLVCRSEGLLGNFGREGRLFLRFGSLVGSADAIAKGSGYLGDRARGSSGRTSTTGLTSLEFLLKQVANLQESSPLVPESTGSWGDTSSANGGGVRRMARRRAADRSFGSG